VLWPLSRRLAKHTPKAPRVPDLNGKTIVELWDVIFRGETIYPLVREHIRKRFPRVKFIEYSEFGNFYGAREEHDIATRLPEMVKAVGADAAIVGIGA
jgi:hypothetical protein